MGIRGTVGGMAKGLMGGAKKLFVAPQKKVMPSPKKTWLTETPEEYGQRLMERRARRY